MAAEEIEQLKLEDGIRLHESIKAELITYARETHQPIVKPFVLVIVRDTAEKWRKTLGLFANPPRCDRRKYDPKELGGSV